MVYQFLLYNKVNQLYIYIYPHISSLLHFPPSHTSYPTPLGHHKAPSCSPCAMQQLPTSYLFYIWQCIYVNAILSQCPSLPFTSMTSSLFSTSASLFLPYHQVHQYHFSRFHIYASNGIFNNSFNTSSATFQGPVHKCSFFSHITDKPYNIIHHPLN